MGAMQDAVTRLGQIRDAIGGLGHLDIDITSCVLASTGAPLAEFSDGASATPGLDLVNSKTWAIRWNNHATPTAVAFNRVLPRDLDDTLPITMKFLVSKTGATAGDATTITVAAYLMETNALHDADSDAGGATGAVDGDLTAKTTTLLSRTIAASDIPAIGSNTPVVLCASFGPTAATLGTDDFLVHAAWIEYTKRYLAS